MKKLTSRSLEFVSLAVRSKRKITKVFVLSMIPIALAMLSLPHGRAHVATFTVKSTADTVDASPGDGICADTCGNCTLRAAIMEANAFSGADIITLPAGNYTLIITGVNEDFSATGDLDITSDLTITGAGANLTTIDAGGIDRVLDIRPDKATNVLISGLTVTGGKTLSPSPGGGAGGGIITHGVGNSLTLTSVTVDHNQADDGGGIFVGGPVILISCTVSNNTALTGSFGGGGILNYINGPLTLNNSTISGNQGARAGGIVTTSWASPIFLNNSTVSFNTGGLYNAAGQVTMKNTILANPSGNCSFQGGTLTSLGHNLSSDGWCTVGLDPAKGDLSNTPAQLAPLALNLPGTTKTHALLSNSPAIDKGGDCLALDQRGVPRPQGAACDIGAYEVGDATPPESTITSGPPSLTKSSSATFSFVSNETAIFQCQLDVGGFAACISPKSYTGLGDGFHALQVRAIDVVGNVDPTSASATWTVDTASPDTNINSALDGNGTALASGGSTLSNSIAFNFGGTDAVGITGFQCRLDGAAYGPCTSPVGHSALSLGSHTFQVRALDAANNVDASPASFTWIVITPAQAIQNLNTTINNMGLAGGVATSLTAPLSNINTNNTAAACAKVSAFINQVNAKVQNGQLVSAQSSQLLQAANAIKAGLGC